MENILKILEAGKLLLSPTDTIWGILCDATNPSAVDRVYQLKKRSDSKAMICMVSDLDMLKQYIPKLPINIKKYIYNDRPTTVIYSNPIAIASNAITEEKTAAIRIVNHHFCTPLISAFGKPLISTSANVSGQEHPSRYADISKEIISGVDYIIKIDIDIINNQASSIIRLEKSGKMTLIRA
jgi:L-threonylcarbamoyladenylate synthase